MADCHICKGERTLIVGWSQDLRKPTGVKWERDPCPGCTPPPHTGYAKRKAAAMTARPTTQESQR